MNVVRFPVEQCRLPGESRADFSARQADEQFWQANFAADLRVSVDPAGADKSAAVIYYIGQDGYVHMVGEQIV